jgi:hypothetical protein
MTLKRHLRTPVTLDITLSQEYMCHLMPLCKPTTRTYTWSIPPPFLLTEQLAMLQESNLDMQESHSLIFALEMCPIVTERHAIHGIARAQTSVPPSWKKKSQ